MWNPSSEKHRSKMEELLADPLRENVGNIHFSRKDNYIISSEGRPKVYLGFSDEYTEVAIREIETDTTDQHVENVKKLLQDVRVFESKNIMKYVGLEEDRGVYYLAAELCECDLEGYMMNGLNLVKKVKAVADVLRGLQALHTVGVIHGALKPSSIFIDSCNTAKLADYDIIYKLKGSSTAETQSWEATEILNEPKKRHTKKSDIQVAGMLVYYILSGRKHPFGDINECEENIEDGTYSLEHVEDIVAKDLIEWMINEEPENRPTIDDVLQHPYFWDNNRKDLILRRLGDRREVQNCRDYDAQLRYVVAEFTTDNIRGWKSRMASWGSQSSKFPEDLLGLLRFLRNKLVHESGSFTHNFHDNLVMNTVREVFPEFFICLHGLAYKLNWEY